MSRIIILLIALFFLNHCSLNDKSRIWKKGGDKLESQKNFKKIFEEDKKIETEFNQELKLDLLSIIPNSKISDNKNNYGAQKYDGLTIKSGNYKFSKFADVNQLNFKPIFLDDGLIFFDNKGSIIRFNSNQKVLWKTNHYSKSEKKLRPKLNFVLDGENLLVADSIANYYSIDINTGELNWLRNSTYPFNSDIKKYKDKILVVDYKNTLRCFKVNDGSECWSFKTEESFTISNSKFSLIIINDIVIFSNSIGDITAINIKTGLITWQLPTQSSSIINETYNFKISKLVSDGNSIIFSNNKNEFHSIDVKTGTINWINEINSNITPIITGNLIFTVSNEGYLIVIEKNKGNIIRVTDLFNNYKLKKRKNIKPVGFAIGNTNLYLTNSDGKMIIVDLSLGNVVNIEKISGDFVSKPFIVNENLFVIRNGSIVQYN
ncbi:PQQ-like beta-propeller repeat protein [Candidatus Pelagibacter sp.]|nr:PQQ-like beta-propeller repeat protein [Candidatus Pelagibacter sp.]MDC1497323.1 PQQ-like beta-propeller repeat protein [Pelagibacteraceae bacterium]